MCGNSRWACPSEHRLRHLELGAQGTEIMGQTVKLMLRLRGCLRDRLVDYLLGLVQDPLRLRLLIQPLDLRVEPAEHLHERLLFAGLGLVKRLQDNSMAVHLSLLRLEEIFDFIDPRDQCFLEVADEARHGGRHLLFELKGEALRVAIGLVDLPSQVAFEIARLSFKRLHSRIQRGDGRRQMLDEGREVRHVIVLAPAVVVVIRVAGSLRRRARARPPVRHAWTRRRWPLSLRTRRAQTLLRPLCRRAKSLCWRSDVDRRRPARRTSRRVMSPGLRCLRGIHGQRRIYD